MLLVSIGVAIVGRLPFLTLALTAGGLFSGSIGMFGIAAMAAALDFGVVASA